MTIHHWPDHEVMARRLTGSWEPVSQTGFSTIMNPEVKHTPNFFDSHLKVSDEIWDGVVSATSCLRSMLSVHILGVY